MLTYRMLLLFYCVENQKPVWDEEFRFDVADVTILQDEPLIFKVYSDSIGANELIGLVYIDLNPLLMQTTREEYDGGEIRGSGEFGGGGDFTRESRSMNSARISSAPMGVIDGWFPLYDTLRSVQGELGLSVKLTFIGDVNPFRDSSAGIKLFPFSTLDPAAGYKISHVFGFVEELVIDGWFPLYNTLGGVGGEWCLATTRALMWRATLVLLLEPMGHVSSWNVMVRFMIFMVKCPCQA